MIDVDQATERVWRSCELRSVRRVSADEAAGWVLAEEILCTTDSPPYDKAQVDGYAVLCGDTRQPGATLRILEEITAGQIPSQTIVAGTATRIMTGAPIPNGTEAVVMVERTELLQAAGEELVRIHDSPQPRQNIMRRGESMRRGEVVLRPGHLLRGIELGLLAELGVTEVSVFGQPTVAIISTGNELVPRELSPGPGQIRNSNGPMLAALVREAGGQPVPLGIARDTVDELTSAIRRGLTADVVLLSGGVSAGVLDLVPQLLRDQGVAEVFHKVRLKPGKPLWFGTRQHDAGKQLVFGLPGNPVSSLVCFHLFVRPAIQRLAGRPPEDTTPLQARLDRPFRQRGDRPTFFPGRVRREPQENELIVEPLGWSGSADLRTLADANVLICFPPGDHDLPGGSLVSLRRL